MSRTIALLTDFGLDDPYVGQMKGVLADKAPDSRIIDVSHGIAPFCISQASFFLAAAIKHFPDDTVFVAVVDPGVGSGRRIIAAEFGDTIVVAPDNGIVELAEADYCGTMIVTDLSETANQMRSSYTFHGRDIFAPIAANIACGSSLEMLGSKLPLRDVVRTGLKKPLWMENGVEAVVLHKDRFGNLVLNIPENQIMPERMSIPDKTPCVGIDAGCVRRACCYAELESGVLGLIVGSQGFYELALYQGSAAEKLNFGPGDSLVLKWGGI
ncbi:S-adenosyl-l-methionine hydroxide adenosyltransferase family protein [Maridesulfovibrio ferrireducens]|uniref:SAM hydrolase/SAM-dependent halogenase family protein n=1 Tax=Maridesulfovibrio ferrireducens TaxID=246191 RepID=UPI001A33B3C4|nr:SAM-dependent chlorinase/fluorinase [Maridesulfovibrio ferrireducens]MBI9112985.1 SAM-dependent chlorinase/fluorinase [Maridesulfovibrio ferrireducens]